METENLILFLEGANGQIYIYTDRAHIVRKGLLADLTHNLNGLRYYQEMPQKEKNIYFYEIEKIEFKRVNILTNGYIRFITSDAKELKSIWNATKDENTVMFGLFQQKKAIEICQYIEECLRRL